MSGVISCLKCGNDMVISNDLYVCLSCGDHLRAPARGSTDVITGRLDKIEKLLGQTRHRLSNAEQKIESMTPLRREMDAVRRRMKKLEERFKKDGTPKNTEGEMHGHIPSQTAGDKMPHRNRP